jgi:hypothetical protein
MIVAARQGRHRYYRLAGHEVAAALEALGLISPALPVRTLRQSREAAALSEARTCYDHLAGRAGVGLLDALLESKSLARTDRGDSASTRFVVTGAGAKTLASFGINVTEVRRSRRRFAGECIDWTQRRGHLNGALAAAITARLFELGWIARVPKTPKARAIAVWSSPRRARLAWRIRSGSAGHGGTTPLAPPARLATGGRPPWHPPLGWPRGDDPPGTPR